MPVTIRPAEVKDSLSWEGMRQKLWPAPDGTHKKEIEAYFAGDRSDPMQVYLAFPGPSVPAGFIELGIRSYAEGCDSGRVAYIEGCFVEAEFRRSGIAAELIRRAEEWGRAVGCTEIASDAEIGNEVSIGLHKSAGFEETGRLVCFRKNI